MPGAPVFGAPGAVDVFDYSNVDGTWAVDHDQLLAEAGSGASAAILNFRNF